MKKGCTQCMQKFCLAAPTFWPYVLLNYCVLQLFRGRKFLLISLLLILELYNAHSRNLNSEASTNFEIITQRGCAHLEHTLLQCLALLLHIITLAVVNQLRTITLNFLICVILNEEAIASALHWAMNHTSYITSVIYNPMYEIMYGCIILP